MLGEAVTPEIAAAWDEVYWLFATQLDRRRRPGSTSRTAVDPAQPLRPYRVVRRIEETDDVVSLVLEPTDGGPLPQIGPGQYVSVFVDLPDGRRQPRQYTVSSTAVATRLQITVRRVRGVGGAPDGMVSSYLHDQATVGDVVDVSAPAGDFVVQPSDGPLLLASAGAGITTVLPIVEHIARTQPQRKVIVAHADRTAQDHALRDTVLHVGRQIDDFTRLHLVRDGSTRPTSARAEGYMDLADIPLRRGRAGLHLRTAAVHAARAVQPAGPRRAGGAHPLRGVRARPVGAAGLIRRSYDGTAGARRPSRRGLRRWLPQPGRVRPAGSSPAGPAAGSSSTAHMTSPPSRVGRTPEDSLTPSTSIIAGPAMSRASGSVTRAGRVPARPYGDAQPWTAAGDRHLDVTPVFGHGVGDQLADHQGRGGRLRAATPVHARPRHQLARLVCRGGVGGHPLADGRGHGAVRE